MKDEPDRPSTPPEQVGEGDRTKVRTAHNPIGIDDIGLPTDSPAENARHPANIDPAPTQDEDAPSYPHKGKDEKRRMPAPSPTPEEEDKTAVEKVMSDIVPASNELTDEDIMNPGRMTPDAPPVDNRS
jgi:hypothetical protein